MQESQIEKVLICLVKQRGGLALKFISPGMAGVPDRLILLPGGKIAFVEVKAPGKRLRLLQVKRKRQLEALGFLVYCLDDVAMIGEILDEICTA
ncbi:MAG: VRR-NUC domain-containing protein [Syntrophomonas sp.]